MIGDTIEKGEKERMNKLISIALIIGLLLGVSAILAPPIMASPPISRPMDLYEITDQGNAPQTVDYSRAYDTASCEIIQNTMDTLLMWNAENASAPYIYAIATNETDGPVTNGVSSIGCPVPSGDSVIGLNFENTNAQLGPDSMYYWQYDFRIRSGVEFAPPYNYSLTPADVAYSFQRTIFQDDPSGPEWMLDEPLLDQVAGLRVATGGLADFSNPTQLTEVGALVRDCVRYNATDVWFNIMFPGAYPQFLGFLCGTWASIESQQWINNQVITAADRPDWSGFSNSLGTGQGSASLTSWVLYSDPPYSPLDYPTPMEYGSGPYTLTPGTPDYTDNYYWSATRNPNWWGGSPDFYPVEAGAQPTGYVNTIEVSWNYPWAQAVAYFEAGACDIVALPSPANIGDLYQEGYSGSYYPFPATSSNLPDAGIRAIAFYPGELSSLSGSYFEYDWVQGWYYNPNYPGLNFANIYKFYYLNESNLPTPLQPWSEYLPADVNRDGVVNMKDLASVARAFGSEYTQPISPYWVFLDDLTNDRVINMKDLAFMAKDFGYTSPIGTFGPLVSLRASTGTGIVWGVNGTANAVTDTAPEVAIDMATGGSVTFTATCQFGYGNINDRVIQWYYGTLTNGQLGAPTAGPSTINAATSTFTWSNIPAGSSYVFCTVTDTFTGSIATARTTAELSNTAVTTSTWAGIYAS